MKNICNSILLTYLGLSCPLKAFVIVKQPNINLILNQVKYFTQVELFQHIITCHQYRGTGSAEADALPCSTGNCIVKSIHLICQ